MKTALRVGGELFGELFAPSTVGEEGEESDETYGCMLRRDDGGNTGPPRTDTTFRDNPPLTSSIIERNDDYEYLCRYV